nr:diguanylate cyclase [Planococcus faecalis]
MNQTLSEGWYINEHQFTPTSSAGIAVYPVHGNSFDSLVKKADAALYLAKAKGKGTCHFYSNY